jgi:hypothetical protein
MAPATEAVLKLRAAFASAKPPEKVTQEAYDGNPQHLRRLIKLRRADRAQSRDLWQYTQDLLYSPEIQGDLVPHVIPFCLEAWRDDLRGIDNGYGGFVEHFYPVLAKAGILDSHLNPKQSCAVAEFMRQSILEEIDEQQGLSYRGAGARSYRWIPAFTTYGVLFADVDRLWNPWWSLSTKGKAIAAVQYISCLAYPASENPVFAPWTPEGGGGPPCLWEFAGHLYDSRWPESNVSFLREVLNLDRVSATLDYAVQCLVGNPEYSVASGIREDLPLCTEMIASRCAELPKILATNEVGRTLEWSL